MRGPCVPGAIRALPEKLASGNVVSAAHIEAAIGRSNLAAITRDHLAEDVHTDHVSRLESAPEILRVDRRLHRIDVAAQNAARELRRDEQALALGRCDRMV